VRSLALLLAAIGTLVASAGLSPASDVDPALPLTLLIGPPPGFAPMARIDGHRRGQSATSLPQHPRTLWRRTVRGGLDTTPLAVDPRGSIVVASFQAAELVQFSAEGVEMWRRPTGSAPSVGGVVLLNDDTRTVVTGAGETLGYSPSGALRFRTAIDLLERASRIGMLPLENGGVALAAGSEVVELDAQGRLDERTRLPERIQGPLVAARIGLIATTQSGTVYLVHEGFAARLAELGGDPGEAGASTPDGERLFAVVSGQKVVVVDLTARLVETRWTWPERALAGPVVFAREQTLTSTTLGGLVLLPRDGSAPQRVGLEPRALLPAQDAGRLDVADEIASPLSDAQGRIAFARAGARLGIATPDGAYRLIDDPVCASPVALVPGGHRRLLVACRSGTIVLLGDEPAP
jgi:hypothetical protein